MELESIVKKLAVTLLNKSFTMATAEECTCGLLGASIASLDHPQRWYKGTITAYTDEIIGKLFSIPSYIIQKNGLISSQVAQQMALDTLYKFNANIVTSVIGDIYEAGGEVQICVAKMSQLNISFSYKKIILNGKTKSENMETVINEALMLTLEHLEN